MIKLENGELINPDMIARVTRWNDKKWNVEFGVTGESQEITDKDYQRLTQVTSTSTSTQEWLNKELHLTQYGESYINVTGTELVHALLNDAMPYEPLCASYKDIDAIVPCDTYHLYFAENEDGRTFKRWESYDGK